MAWPQWLLEIFNQYIMPFWNSIKGYDWLAILIVWFLDKFTTILPFPESWETGVALTVNKVLKRNKLIDISYHFKTPELELEKDDIDVVNQLMQDNGFVLEAPVGDWYKYSFSGGNISPEIILRPVAIFNEEEEKDDVVSIEFEMILTKIKYHNFDGDINDLLRIREKVQTTLYNKLGELQAFSLSCKLSKFYRFTGLLSDFNIKKLSGELDGNKFEFYSNEIILYGEVYQNILKLLKDVIAYYY